MLLYDILEEVKQTRTVFMRSRIKTTLFKLEINFVKTRA